MPATSFNHINIKAPAKLLKACRDFYIDIVGLHEGYRPECGDEGYWLYGDSSEALIHMTITEDRMGGASHYDHAAFNCTDLPAMQHHLTEHGVLYSEETSRDGTRHQIFMRDPCSLGVELNFKL